MSLKERISDDLKVAMKEKKTIELSILRVLKGEIQRHEQGATGRIDLTDNDIMLIVKKLVEGIKTTTNNLDEIQTLEQYLPAQLSIDEIKKIITESNLNNLGEIMKFFKNNYNNLYDGKILSNIVKEMIK